MPNIQLIQVKYNYQVYQKKINRLILQQLKYFINVCPAYSQHNINLFESSQEDPNLLSIEAIFKPVTKMNNSLQNTTLNNQNIFLAKRPNAPPSNLFVDNSNTRQTKKPSLFKPLSDASYQFNKQRLENGRQAPSSIEKSAQLINHQIDIRISNNTNEMNIEQSQTSHTSQISQDSIMLMTSQSANEQHQINNESQKLIQDNLNHLQSKNQFGNRLLQNQIGNILKPPNNSFNKEKIDTFNHNLTIQVKIGTEIEKPCIIIPEREQNLIGNPIRLLNPIRSLYPNNLDMIYNQSQNRTIDYNVQNNYDFSSDQPMYQGNNYYNNNQTHNYQPYYSYQGQENIQQQIIHFIARQNMVLHQKLITYLHQQTSNDKINLRNPQTQQETNVDMIVGKWRQTYYNQTPKYYNQTPKYYNQTPKYFNQYRYQQNNHYRPQQYNDFQEEAISFIKKVKQPIRRVILTQKQEQALQKQALLQRRLKYKAKMQNKKKEQQEKKQKQNQCATPSTSSSPKSIRSASNQPYVSSFDQAAKDQSFYLSYQLKLVSNDFSYFGFKRYLRKAKLLQVYKGKVKSDRHPIEDKIAETVFKHIKASNKQIQQVFATQSPTIYSNIQYLNHHIHVTGKIVLPLLLSGLPKDVTYGYKHYNGHKVQGLIISHPNASIEWLQPVSFGSARSNRDLSNKLILTDIQIDIKQSYLNKKCNIRINRNQNAYILNEQKAMKNRILEDKKTRFQPKNRVQQGLFQNKIQFYVLDWLVSWNVKSKLLRLRTIVYQKVESIWNNAQGYLENTRI